jgi:hypothetical protein
MKNKKTKFNVEKSPNSNAAERQYVKIGRGGGST